MGSYIELNDTLQISNEQGFPVDVLNLEEHQKNPIHIEEIQGEVFLWHSKPKARMYHTFPCRCFLVENRDNKWIYWGHIQILSQTIKYDEATGGHVTSGTYRITKIYPPKQQKMMGGTETPDGMNYFEENGE